jgi:hypothetical protein
MVTLIERDNRGGEERERETRCSGFSVTWECDIRCGICLIWLIILLISL